jgi:hypothetical protein
MVMITSSETNRLKRWLEICPDIPYTALVPATCRKCGQSSWTEQGLYHWCLPKFTFPKKEEIKEIGIAPMTVTRTV